jgi:outer membrane lipoprotein-sorting protein
MTDQLHREPDDHDRHDHPVDALLTATLTNEPLPSAVEERLLARVDRFTPRSHRWRWPATISGALAAVLVLSAVWMFGIGQMSPAYAWEQMQANMAAPAETVSFWMTQKMVKPDGTAIVGRAFYRFKAGLGSRMDVYELANDPSIDRRSDKVTFIRADGSQEDVDYMHQVPPQCLTRHRSYRVPANVKRKQPETVNQFEAMVQQMINAEVAVLEGEEKLDGRRVLIYRIPADQVVAKTKDAKNEPTVHVWIDAKELLLVQWQVHLLTESGGESTFTGSNYVRNEPIDDAVFELPADTADWDRYESWHIRLSPEAKLEAPLRIRVGLAGEQPWLTENDFRTSGDRTDLDPQDREKLRTLTKDHVGEPLQVHLNDQLVAEQVIDWPIEQITVFGTSYWLQ